jgi:hypothetical protein
MNNKYIYWVTGNYYDSRKFLKSLYSQFLDSNLVTIECGYNSANNKVYANTSDVISTLRTKDIFNSSRRIIKLLGIPSDYTELTNCFKYCNENNILVIDSPIGYYKPAGSGSQFVSAATSNFYKEIKKNYNMLEFEDDAKTEVDATKWLTVVAQELNIKIENEAVKLIVDATGKNYDSLYAEINKYSGLERLITKDDILNNSVPSLTKEVWDFITCLQDMKLESSAIHLEKFFEDNITDSDFRTNTELYLGALRQNFELLLHAKDGCKKNDSLSYNGFVSAISGLKKISNEKDKEPVDKFNKYIVNMKIKDMSFISSFSWKKSRIYKIMLYIDFIRKNLRFGTNLSLIKAYMYMFVLFVCNYITEKEIDNIFQ